MNAFNRLIVVLGSLALIVAVVAVIVLAWGFSGDAVDRMGDLVEYVDAHENNTARLVLTLGGAIIGVIALIVLLLELSPGPSRMVEIGEVEGGKAFLSTDAIGRRLEQLTGGVGGVTSSRARVSSQGKAVAVALHLQVSPEHDIAAIADQASGLTRDALATMKVRLSRPPRIHITYVEPPPGLEFAPPPPAPQPETGIAASAEKGPEGEAEEEKREG
ncbi:MAG: hypothetical protein QME71_10765 [Dehalococcoidia bacterium]|nr:hypothetical protein [Dehalococcoidia bacterium]